MQNISDENEETKLTRILTIPKKLKEYATNFM